MAATRQQRQRTELDPTFRDQRRSSVPAPRWDRGEVDRSRTIPGRREETWVGRIRSEFPWAHDPDRPQEHLDDDEREERRRDRGD